MKLQWTNNSQWFLHFFTFFFYILPKQGSREGGPDCNSNSGPLFMKLQWTNNSQWFFSPFLTFCWKLSSLKGKKFSWRVSISKSAEYLHPVDPVYKYLSAHGIVITIAPRYLCYQIPNFIYFPKLAETTSFYLLPARGDKVCWLKRFHFANNISSTTKTDLIHFLFPLNLFLKYLL